MLLLSGCATTQVNQPVIQDAELLKKYQELQNQSYRFSFLMNMNTCFINHNKCMIHIGKKKQCWKSHERCVVDTYRMYKAVKANAEARRNHENR